MNNVIQLRKPQTYTRAEQIIERLQEAIFASKMSYTVLAMKTGVGSTTIRNIASGRTRWPRPTTLFPLLEALGLSMAIVKK